MHWKHKFYSSLHAVQQNMNICEWKIVYGNIEKEMAREREREWYNEINTEKEHEINSKASHLAK